jgi:hypothetical protein
MRVTRSCDATKIASIDFPRISGDVSHDATHISLRQHLIGENVQNS